MVESHRHPIFGHLLTSSVAGLDSFNAYNVVECLVSLARNYQRTILMTIHQPRSNIYALFDVVVLLAKGKMIYSGPAQEEVIHHFEKLGFFCPLGFNIADYLGGWDDRNGKPGKEFTLRTSNCSRFNHARDRFGQGSIQDIRSKGRG